MKTENDFATAPRLTSPAENPHFNVVIAYDQAESASRAMRLVDGLVAEFGNDFIVHRDLWRFDILALPAVREETSASAAHADLVVIAAAADAELPVPVKNWLERWSAESFPGTTALAAVLQARPSLDPDASSVHCYLQALAREAGHEFFTRRFAAPSAAPGWSFEQIQKHANQPSSVLLGILERSRFLPCRGINEEPDHHERVV